MNPTLTLVALASVLMLTACSGVPPVTTDTGTTGGETAGETDAKVADSGQRGAPADNPLLVPSPLPYGAPPFDRIEAEHFPPALERGMALERAEVEAIVSNPEGPSFGDTIVALERAGQDLARVQRIFSALSGTMSTPTLQRIQREMAPRLSAHRDAIMLDPALFERISALHARRGMLQLDAESRRLLERYHLDFVRAGAMLDPERQDRLREINARSAEIGALFRQHVLAEAEASAVIVEREAQLDGLSPGQIRRAAEEAAERGFEGAFAITLVNTSGQPPLDLLRDRAVRERVQRASVARGARGNEYDTTALVTEMVALRSERARLLGYATHADYVMADRTAGSIEAVNAMLAGIAPLAVANARREGEALQARIDATEPEPFPLAAWDWAFYAQQEQRARFDFDEAEVRPYFELQSVLENGVFHAATRLYGITFERRSDLPVWHPDVQVWEVFDEDGSPIGLMYGDFHARPGKRGGAWMNSFVLQSSLLYTRPVTGNHLNIPRPPEGEPTLMTWREVNTLFHEFGHVLHGLFSEVTYPRFSGTRVPRDFVEYPSQVNEMWAAWPSILAHYARHHETGERIPQQLLERVLAAGKFNEGFRTTEYIAAAIIDQALHQLPPESIPSPEGLMDFEARVLSAAGLDYAPVPPRYRYPYFSHIMGSYAAGYYAYIWSEVLDADNVQWFEENEGLTRANGDRYRNMILSRGGSRDAMEMYRAFAGREPDPVHLLRRRGLVVEED